MKIFHWGMINPITRAPFSFDDPNVQWGDPGYYLEPTDPGFVPCPGFDTGGEAHPTDEWTAQPAARISGELPAAPERAVFACEADGTSYDDFSVSLCPEADSADNTMDAAVSEITGIPGAKCAEVLGAYLDQLLACAAGSGLAQGIHDLLNICPSSAKRPPGKEGYRILADALAGAAGARRVRRF